MGQQYYTINMRMQKHGLEIENAGKTSPMPFKSNRESYTGTAAVTDLLGSMKLAENSPIKRLLVTDKTFGKIYTQR